MSDKIPEASDVSPLMRALWDRRAADDEDRRQTLAEYFARLDRQAAEYQERKAWAAEDERRRRDAETYRGGSARRLRK